MFEKPGNVEPNRRKEGEPESQRPTESRPAEKMTPSQEGRYLSALDKKKEKKSSSKDDKSVEGKEEDLFQLARTSRIKGQKDAGAETGEEGEQQASSQMGQGAFQQGQMAMQQEPQGQTSLRPGPAEPEFTSRISPISGKAATAPVRLPNEEVKVEEQPRVKGTKELGKRTPESSSSMQIAPEAQDITKPTPEIAMASPEGTKEATRIIRPEFIDLAKQLAEGISALISKAVTTITVMLKYPPTFEGASIVVTEHLLARKEFNVTFVNLSPDARRLVESTTNQGQLRQALVERGYTLHMITIETPRTFITPASGYEERSREERRGENQREDRPRK